MRLRAIILLALSYALLGIAMNSVGAVILQSITHFGVTKTAASSLEACKDLAVVAASFLLAARIASFGFRHTVMAVMAGMALACFSAAYATEFLAMQILFAMTGFAFGVAKIATYSLIGVIARDAADHASITSAIEGVFMIGVLSGAWIFSFYIGSGDPVGWLRVYWLLAALFASLAVLWLSVRLDEGASRPGGESATALGQMLALAVLPASIAVLAGLFLYVLIEQAVGTWLPTFNAQVLRLPQSMSVQMSSIYVAAIAAGRLFFGVVLRRAAWQTVLLGCLAGAAILVIATLPLARLGSVPIHSWLEVPMAGWLFPLIGFFLAPLYPTICSVALSRLEPRSHPAMIGLIVIFSALGGTIGSFIMGLLFDRLPGATAFYFVLGPLGLMAGAIILSSRRAVA